MWWITLPGLHERLFNANLSMLSLVWYPVCLNYSQGRAWLLSQPMLKVSCQPVFCLNLNWSIRIYKVGWIIKLKSFQIHLNVFWDLYLCIKNGRTSEKEAGFITWDCRERNVIPEWFICLKKITSFKIFGFLEIGLG